MAQTIKIKRSATSGNKLTGSNSIAGEIGMNTADKSLYIQTGSTDASVVTVYDDSILHLDDTNNRVGIGTTSPSVPLHVNGFARFSDIQLTGTDPQVAAINNTSLVFKTNNTEVARFDASGNLGIGTTAPQSVLDLGNATNGRGISWGGGGGTAHYNTIWSEYSTASIIIGAGLKGATGSATFLNPFTGTYGYAAIELDSFSDDGIKFYTGADASRTKDAAITPTEQMRLDNSGRLGIGTSSPAYQLDVDGTGRFTGAVTLDSTLSFTDTTAANVLDLNNNNIIDVNNIRFADAGPNEGLEWNGGNTKIFESPDDLTTNTAGNLQFVYNGTRRLSVNNTGIDVNGTITGATNISKQVARTATGGTGTEDGPNTWAKLATYSVSGNYQDGTFIYGVVTEEQSLPAAGTIIVRVRWGDLAGSVNPTVKVEWTSKNSGNTLGTDAFKLIGDGVSDDIELWVQKDVNYGCIELWELAYRKESNNSVSVSYEDNSAWQSSTPTGTAVNETSGTLTFDGKEVLLGDEFNNTTDFKLSGKLNVLASVNTNDAAYIRNSGTGAAFAVNQQGTGDILRVDDNSTTKLIVKDGGRVGIGTSSPSHELDVSGTVRQAGTYNLDLSDGSTITGSNHVYIKGTTSYVRLSSTNNSIYYDAGTDHVFRGGDSTEYMRIDTNGTNVGNVGIGTASPAYKLDVNGTFRSAGNAYFEGSNVNFSTAGANVKFNGGGGYISTTTAHALRLQTNNTEALRLTSGQDAVFSGDITVSKDDPTITLLNNSGANTDPNGTIIFSEISGTNNFKINYNGADDRLEFIGLISSTETDLVYINRSTAPAVNIFGELHVGGHIKTTANSHTISSRKISARDTNGLDLATSDGTSRVTIANTGITTFNATVRANLITGTDQTSSFLNLDDDNSGTGSNSVSLESISALNLKFDSNNNDTNGLNVFSNGGTTPIFKIFDTGAVRFNNAFTFPTSDGSANQVLKTDGSGNVTWATEAATSASTSMSDADGDTKIQVEETADEDRIRFDTAGTERMIITNGGYVGIGTTSPGHKLQVNVAADDRIALNQTSANNFGLQFQYAGTRTWDIYNNGAASSKLFFYSEVLGGSAMTITNAGKVGIGTNTPSTNLHIQTANDNIALFESTDNKSYITIKDNDTTVYVSAENSRGSFGFQTGTHVNNLNIDTSGNVGLNTSSPLAKLDVRGITWTAGTGDGTLVQKLGVLDSTANTSLVNIYTDDAGSTRPLGGDALEFNTARYGQVIGATRGSAAGGNVRSWKFTTSTNSDERGADLILYSQADSSATGSTTTAGNVQLSATSNRDSYINTSGNFGLGTASPSRKFEVHENTTNLTIGEKSGYSPGTYGPVFETNADALVLPQYAYLKGSQAYIRNESNLMRIHGDSGIKFSYYNGSTTTEGIRLDNSGNVGIGTTTPDTRLDVTTSGVNGLVLNSDTSTTTNSARLFFKASGGTVGMLNVSNSLSFRTGMTINSTSGTERLNINSTHVASTNTVLLKGANDNSGKADFALNTGGSPTVSLHGTQVQLGSSDQNWNGKISYISGSGVYFSAWDNDLRLTTSGGSSSGARNIRFEPQASGGSSTLRMIINGDGNVGIGTDSPADRLEIKDNHSQLRLTDSDDNKFVQFSYSGGFLAVRNNNASTSVNLFSLHEDGDFGIGTLSPSSALHVKRSGASSEILSESDTGYATVKLDSATGAGAGVRFFKAGTEKVRLESIPTDHHFQIKMSGTEMFRVTQSGYVGIGTTNPVQKLQVDGNIYANGGQFFVNNNSGISAVGDLVLKTHNGSGYQTSMHLDGADNHVGIGTTTPQQKLTVRGATLFSAGDEGSRHGTEFNWVKSNTGSGGNGIWYKVADISLTNTAYSAMAFEAYYETGLNNFGSHNYLDVREVFVSIVRNNTTSTDNSPDSATLRGRTSDIRVYKTAAGTYELQARHNSQNAKYAVRVRVFQTNGGTITPKMDGSTAGTNSGGTEYTVAEPATTEGVRRYLADIDSSRIHLGNVDLYPSGNLSYIHVSGSGVLPQSTVASSNGSLGTSTYLWNGVFSRRFQGEVSSAGAPTFTFSEDSNTGMYDEWYDQSNSKRQLSFSVDGIRRLHLNEAGVWSAGNFYLPSTGASLRSFHTYTEISNGTSGNGFRMRNSADGVDSLIVTSAGNGTFAGSLTVNGNIDLNGSNITDVTQINGNGGSGWLDFDMDTDNVYPQSTSDNQTVLGSITHMNFVGDSNGNGTGGNFYWGYGVSNGDAGTFTQTMSLTRAGDLDVAGALTATTKSFDIEHPTKEGMRLHHGSLEGPEHGVYVRGKSQTGVIQLPDYWMGLVDEDTITVQLTAIGKPQELYVEKIEDNKVYVSGENYFYFVQAERKDIEKFEVEYAV